LSDNKFVIHQMPGSLAVARLDPKADVPTWSGTGSLCAVVRTPDELTVVCDQTVVPEHVITEGGWVALAVEGPLSFSMVGVLVSLLEPLAANKIPVFVLSTFDTDYILVKAERAEVAKQVLRSNGHHVE
jgi:hypothetical protein